MKKFSLPPAAIWRELFIQSAWRAGIFFKSCLCGPGGTLTPLCSCESAAEAKWVLLLSVRVTGSNPTGATSPQRACTQGEVKRFWMTAIKAAIKIGCS